MAAKQTLLPLHAMCDQQCSPDIGAVLTALDMTPTKKLPNDHTKIQQSDSIVATTVVHGGPSFRGMVKRYQFYTWGQTHPQVFFNEESDGVRITGYMVDISDLLPQLLSLQYWDMKHDIDIHWK